MNVNIKEINNIKRILNRIETLNDRNIYNLNKCNDINFYLQSDNSREIEVLLQVLRQKINKCITNA